MALDFDNFFGIHPQAIALRSRRMQLIASNLANADTPGYLARDIDFRATLRDAHSGAMQPRRTDERHLGPGAGPAAQLAAGYRIPLQPAVDGNTVDAQFEQTAFADNAVRFQASLMFLDRRVRGLVDAIKGGQP